MPRRDTRKLIRSLRLRMVLLNTLRLQKFLSFPSALVLLLTLAALAAAQPAPNRENATAACYVRADGTLQVIPLGFGAGYTTAPRVTLQKIPTGASATIVPDPPIDGEIRSYRVTASAHWPQTIAFGQLCPSTLVVDPPSSENPLASSATPVRAMAMPATIPVHAASLTLRVDDFGARGDGVTDDRRAVQAAMDAAEALTFSSPGSNPVVSFTSGKNYFIGSIGGYYSGAFDDGSVPVAAELRCHASAGNVTGCSIVSHGYGLIPGHTPIVVPPSVSGRGIQIQTHFADCSTSNCPQPTGSRIDSISATGGSGYPGEFSVYVGPTCSGVPCHYLQPETPAQIGYGVRLPNNITIEGNGAVITGAFTPAAAAEPTYSNGFPYIATFANFRGGDNIIRNLTLNNVFIGIGNLGAFMDIENIGVSGAIAIQGQQSQYDTVRNLNANCRNCSLESGIVVGGQWGTRSPMYSQEGDYIANSMDIGDALTVHNFTFFQRDSMPTPRKALDCWFDRNFFHVEDQGIQNSLACYTPPGGVTRMTDQDLAGQQEPDDLWRGIFGIPVAIYTRYGRPTNGITMDGIDGKANLNYLVVAGPHINFGHFSNLGIEGSGYCQNHAIYGSDACPNPYEPFTAKPLGLILTDSNISVDGIAIIPPYQSAITYPWQIPPPLDSSISHVSQNTSVGHLEEPEAAPGNSGQQFRPQYVWISHGNALNADSESAEFLGTRYTFQNQLDTWQMRVHDIFQPANYPALMEIRSVQGGDIYGRAYLKTNGLAIDPIEVQNGQVTALVLTNPGSGYPANAHVGCQISPSTNPAVTIQPSGAPYQATCYGVTNAAGQLFRLDLGQPGLGYAAPPKVTLDPPSPGGMAATAQATIAHMQSFLPVGHMVIDSFYLPAPGVVAPGTSVTLSHLPCPDANGVASSAPAMQDQVSVISMGSQSWAVPGVVASALATGFGQCSVTLDNRSATPLHYGSGTARQPWELLIVGPASGSEQAAGYGPQGILASAVTLQTMRGDAYSQAANPASNSLAATTGVLTARLAAGCTSVGQLHLPGVNTSMACVMSGAGGNPAGVIPQCSVAAPDTVQIQLCAPLPVSARPQRYNVRVLP